MSKPRIEPEDLDVFIRNHSRYVGAIKRLDLEIEAKEVEINRVPGSIIKMPDGTNKASNSTLKQVQLFHELGELQDERAHYQSRIDRVQDILDFYDGEFEGFVINSLKNGFSFLKMETSFLVDRKKIQRKYWKALERYLKG